MFCAYVQCTYIIIHVHCTYNFATTTQLRNILPLTHSPNFKMSAYGSPYVHTLYNACTCTMHVILDEYTYTHVQSRGTDLYVHVHLHNTCT